ncbi:RHS repeat domain-containing protein [Paracoccus methylarcula]|uniref:RHS repeat protein n=1 Tax=Paracoccus methylarcula TaxID=72022 RepID=A0A422QX22_9RHOB|nr:RHS repeat-associated core domain-containing protein [Paracoccus methylarcula]RNF34517.1 RHS repeat protein [Paracoccus methylarcula]
MRSQQIEAHAGRIRRRGNITYQHDACGRVIEKRHDEPGFRPRIWQMTWDAHDRLVRLRTPDGSVWRYEYDALGRRIRRLRVIEGGAKSPARQDRASDDWSLTVDTPAQDQSSAGDPGGVGPRWIGSAYQWDGDCIAAEAPIYADGTVAWDQAAHWIYEPGSFRPIACVNQDHIAHVVTDHLGTPHELVSEDGRKVLWRAELGLWGKLDHAEQAANDDHPPVSCPIRFQGQWEDPESGLYYNRHRYYDPDATQYLSPDPIGLAGGIRPQGYVADPNGWVDPLGLAGCPEREVNGTKIYGTGQKDKTPGHNQFSEVISNKLAMSGKFDRIYMHRAYNTALGPGISRRQPDVLAIDRNGRVHAIELASWTDMRPSRYGNLSVRNNNAMRNLPPSQRGQVIVLDHPYNAQHIKNALDNLIGGIR